MRGRLVLFAALVAVLAAVLGSVGSAGAAPGGCAGTGTASGSPGLTLKGVKTVSLRVNAKVNCVGTTSGAVSGTGSLTGTCQKLTGYVNVSGALTGYVTVKTNGPTFQLTGKLNNHPFNAAGTFVPKTGNCVTVPLTSATIAFAGAFLK